MTLKELLLRNSLPSGGPTAIAGEPYPLPQDEVAAVLRKWMRGEALSSREHIVVSYALEVNLTELRERNAHYLSPVDVKIVGGSVCW